MFLKILSCFLLLILAPINSFANEPNGLSIIEIQNQEGQVGRISGFLIGNTIYTNAHAFMDETDSSISYQVTRVLSIQDGELVELNFSAPVIHDEYGKETSNVRAGARMFDIAKIEVSNENLKSDYVLPEAGNYAEFNNLFEIYGSNEIIHSIGSAASPGVETVALDGVSSFLLPVVLQYSNEAGPGRLEALGPQADSQATVMFSVGKAQVKPGWSGSPVSLVVPGLNKYVVIGLLRGRSFDSLGAMFNSLPEDFVPHLNNFPIEIVSVTQLNNWTNSFALTCRGILN